jgi:hypothetical protein
MFWLLEFIDDLLAFVFALLAFACAIGLLYIAFHFIEKYW